MNRGREWFRLLYRVSYWVIPAVILYLVFRRIDFSRLLDVLRHSNPWLVAVGIAYYPIVIFIGAWRWRALLLGYIGSVPRRFVLTQYWTGLALGYFLPGSVGWDAYRVAVTGRRYGRYGRNIAVIVVEKLAALLCCTTIIVVLSPAVPVSGRPGLSGILRSAYVLIIGLAAGAGIIALVWRNHALWRRLQDGAGNAVNGLFRRFNPNGAPAAAEISLKGMIEPVTRMRCLLPVLALSFAIQIFGGLANQVFFMALGYDISLVANLFLSPVLFFIFLLPISFGSLGVREGAYIVLYGMWGVPAETALLVSFFNLIGVLLNNAIGGLVMLGSFKKDPLLRKAAE